MIEIHLGLQNAKGNIKSVYGSVQPLVVEVPDDKMRGKSFTYVRCYYYIPPNKVLLQPKVILHVSLFVK